MLYTTKKVFATILMMVSAITAYGQAAESDGTSCGRMAVVATSTCYMRQQPDYESALETQELMGTIVEITGEKGYWREIQSPQPYKAWTTEKTLVEMTPEQIREYEEAPKYIFTARYGHVYTTPTRNNPSAICDLVGGDMLRVVEKKKGQTGPSGKHGRWVEVMLPTGRTGWVPRENVRLLGERTYIRKGDASQGLISPEKLESVIHEAYSLLGVPYLWGGMSSKGVDCSGLVRISFLMNDIMLPRNASQQVHCGMEVEVPRPDIAGRTQDEVKESYNREKALEAIRSLHRGDLVFFGNTTTGRITHVGIYLGKGRMIHASHLVRTNSLIPGDEGYYENAHRIIRACRLCY